jgi:hypothetical protein
MFEELNEKQIRDRSRYLSDKIDAIWNKISPDLQEFDNLRTEFESLYVEMSKRGMLDGPQQSRENLR